MALICASCATSNPVPIKPVYPVAPIFMSQVSVPLLAEGEDAKAALARNRAALFKANNNLKQSREWYENLAQ